jgi:hypothetical protein
MTTLADAVGRVGQYTESQWWSAYAGERHVTLRLSAASLVRAHMDVSTQLDALEAQANKLGLICVSLIEEGDMVILTLRRMWPA